MDDFPVYGCGQAIENRWRVQKRLGAGGFGVVYRVTDLYDPDPEKALYAIKMEHKSPEECLHKEVYVLKLALFHKCQHFCRYISSGITTAQRPANFMVMTLIGDSLDAKRREHRFTMGCALSVGMQCVTAIEEIHSIGVLHRDLKPENFAVAKEDESRVIIIDFGLARPYLDGKGRIRLPRFVSGFRGTTRYAPLSCHLRREMCRKDDLESWFYMQVELTKGMLPWRAEDCKDELGLFKERCRYGVGLDVFLGGCPSQFVQILRYIDGLGYYDQPDYNKIHNLMRMAMQAHDVFETYDWVERAKEQAKKVIAKKI